MVLETTRTLLIWALNLLLFYSSPAQGVQLGEPWTRNSWLQALGFAVLVTGTAAYGHGEEVQERRLRARLRWARVHASLAQLVAPHAAEARRPMRAPRIAGPGRIRTAFMQRAVVEHLLRNLEQHRQESQERQGVRGGAAAIAGERDGGTAAAWVAAAGGGEADERQGLLRDASSELEP